MLVQSLLCCSIFWVPNSTKMLSSRIIVASAWKWVWISSYCFWVLSEFWAKGKRVAVGNIDVAATYWPLLRCVKPFCFSYDTLPVFSVDHHVLEYLDGYCQPVEERWTSSPPRKGRNVASNELSSPAIIYFQCLSFNLIFFSSVIILPFDILRWYEQKCMNIYNLQEIEACIVPL